MIEDYDPYSYVWDINRATIWKDETFWAEYNVLKINGEPCTFLHLQIFEPWSVPMFRNVMRHWKEFRKNVTCPLFTMADEDSDTLNRLREHFGFKHFADIPCSDGTTRRLYLHIV